MVVATVVTITSFGTDVGDGGNITTDNNTNIIVSIHLADYRDKCSKHNNDGSAESFESIENDGRTSDNNNVSITDALDVTGKLNNENTDNTVITGDNDDCDNDDNSDAECMSSGENYDDSSQEDSIFADDNINSTTNPTGMPLCRCH